MISTYPIHNAKNVHLAIQVINNLCYLLSGKASKNQKHYERSPSFPPPWATLKPEAQWLQAKVPGPPPRMKAELVWRFLLTAIRASFNEAHFKSF